MYALIALAVAGEVKVLSATVFRRHLARNVFWQHDAVAKNGIYVFIKGVGTGRNYDKRKRRKKGPTHSAYPCKNSLVDPATIRMPAQLEPSIAEQGA